MAGKPRFTLAGVPQHVIHRGNNRAPCFYAESDYQRYLHDLKEAAEKNNVVIDAYTSADGTTILNQILQTGTAGGNPDCNQDSQVNVQDLVCLNIRIANSTTPGGGTTLFAYDEQGQLIGEYDQSGNAIEETVYLGSQPVAVLKSSNVYYIHTDQLNTPRVITDSANTVVWRWDSDPFGATAANDDPDLDGTRFTYNLRFPGQYYDQETGLHYNYFRDYDPGTGRYIESDPIGLMGGLNTYSYVTSNPLLRMDPSGLWGIPGPFGPVCGPEGSAQATWIPDGIFRSACQRHDNCYGTCGADKSECDEVFYKQLKRTCNGTGGCLVAAWVYYEAVKQKGSQPYQEAQKKDCKNCGK